MVLPWSRIFWFSSLLNFIQGCATAIFDVGTNQEVLRLWRGISSSPINALHAAYGLGGVIALQLVRPFVKFDPYLVQLQNSTSITNYTNVITSADIKLQLPFGLSSAFGSFICIGFLIAQYFELKHVKQTKKDEEVEKSAAIALTDVKQDECADSTNDVNIVKFPKFQGILFENVRYKNNAIYVFLAELFLVFMLFLSVAAFLTVGNYLLTYFTKGPAKLPVNDFITIQTIFWACFTIGRILAVYIGYKVKPYIFYFALLIITLLCVFLCVLPYFTNKIAVWILLSLIGLATGPLIPSSFMVCTSALKYVNSFVVGLVCIAANIGCMLCQYTTGYLLDNFHPPSNWLFYNDATSIYIVPFIMFSYMCLCFLIFILLIFVSNRYEKFLNENLQTIKI